MILNSDQIQAKNIIDPYHPEQSRIASYDLTIKKFIDMNGIVHENFKLKPQGMVYVIFAEKITLPSTMIGFAHVKTSLTKRGILATHTGIIDPMYDGYMSTLLINYGNTEYTVLKNERALRVTFFSFDEPKATKPSISVSEETYTNDAIKNTDYLDEKFLNLSNVEKDVSKTLIQRFFGILAIFSAGSFLVAMYFQFKNSQFNDTDRSIKRYEIQLNLLQDQNRLLERKIDDLKDSISHHH